MRFSFDRRTVTFCNILGVAASNGCKGGVLFLKFGNILCSPAPSRALVIFDAASTISLPPALIDTQTGTLVPTGGVTASDRTS
jgi:hypothetical protein